MSGYEVHLSPPDYPAGCHPWRCKHEPQFVMQADLHLTRPKRGPKIEIDHSVCFACGKPMPCTVGGNVLVDLQMLWERLGWHAKLGARILVLRNKWARIATYLFDETGWNGRRETVARMIDPKLIMRLRIEPIDHPTAIANRHRIGVITFDPSYLREVRS